MSLLQTLLDHERALTRGEGDTYRELLTEDAIVVVPGARMTKAETAAAIDVSPGWDEVDFVDPLLSQPAEGVAVLTYWFQGRRGMDEVYEAQLSSVYVDQDGVWRLCLHQQTPAVAP